MSAYFIIDIKSSCMQKKQGSKERLSFASYSLIASHVAYGRTSRKL